MRVAFDNQIFLLQKFGGVSRYFVELAKSMNDYPDIETRLITPLHFNHHLQNSNISPKGFFIPFTTDALQMNRMVRTLSTRFSRSYLSQWKPDLLHETFYSDVDSWPKGLNRVATVHDLIREKYEPRVSKASRKQAAISRASAIICVSESTRNDFLNYYNVSEEKVKRVYVGVNEKVWTAQPVDSPVNRNFILYVGHRNGYKNFDLLLQAYASSALLKSDFCIVTFGGDPLSAVEKRKISDLGLSNSVIHAKGNDAKLSKYYRAASVFVYPSKYEGFGSPNLEAMSSGCPVLCSDISPFRESAGKAGLFFDPNSIESLRSNLESLLFDSEQREKLTRAGIAHAAQFSWSKCAWNTTQVYATVR